MDRSAKEKILLVFSDFETIGYSRRQPFYIGKVEPIMIDYAQRNNIRLASHAIYMTVSSLFHSRRPAKDRSGKTAPAEIIADFPLKRRKMALYYHHGGGRMHDRPAFVYTDYIYKYVVQMDGEVVIKHKKSRHVCYITTTKIQDPKEFENTTYEKIR